MGARWKLEVMQDSPARYSVDDIRRIIVPLLAICGGKGKSVYHFNFESEKAAWAADAAIR